MAATFGPYSPWRRAGDFVILSGQLGVTTREGVTDFVDPSAPAQLRQALANAAALLEEAGARLDQVVKGTLFLVSMEDFSACNEVWTEVFAAPRPTRSAFAVAELPLGARCEVELWAYAPAS